MKYVYYPLWSSDKCIAYSSLVAAKQIDKAVVDKLYADKIAYKLS